MSPDCRDKGGNGDGQRRADEKFGLRWPVLVTAFNQVTTPTDKRLWSLRYRIFKVLR
jgi:hypothetical protein